MRIKTLGAILESPFKLFEAVVIEPWLWPPKLDEKTASKKTLRPYVEILAQKERQIKAMKRQHEREIRWYERKLREYEKRLKSRR